MFPFSAGGNAIDVLQVVGVIGTGDRLFVVDDIDTVLVFGLL